MKSIAKFVAICSKFASERNYSQVIRMSQHDGKQVYTYSDGFFAVCLSISCQDMGIVAPTIIPLGCNTMLSINYPDVFEAVNFDMSSVVLPTDEQADHGQRIKQALANVKVSASTSINPVTLAISHDKTIPVGHTRAGALSKFSALGCLSFTGIVDKCARFVVSPGGNCQIVLCSCVTTD